MTLEIFRGQARKPFGNKEGLNPKPAIIDFYQNPPLFVGLILTLGRNLMPRASERCACSTPTEMGVGGIT